MSNLSSIYETEENITPSGVQYFFISEGKIDIIKAVQYKYIDKVMGIEVYNLGFGNYDPTTDTITDDSTDNNGDHYLVLHTVLSTIPHFFRIYNDAMLMVRGSDSREEFKERCKQACKKKCKPIECKNFHRRINIYKHYVNKNYTDLVQEYIFWGSEENNDNQIIIEKYHTTRDYDAILLRKKY